MTRRRTAFALGTLTGAALVYAALWVHDVSYRLAADRQANAWIEEMARGLPPDQVRYFG